MHEPPKVGLSQRVVLLGSFAPSLINFRGPLIEALVARGHQVFALAPSIDEEVSTKLKELGARPVSIRLGATSLNPFAALRSQNELRHTLEAIRPDVVIAYTIKPVVLGARAAEAAGVKRFVPLITGLGYAFTGGLEPKRILSRIAASLLYRRAFNRSSIALFQNRDDLQDFKRLRLLPPWLATGLVNGSGVDLRQFLPTPVPRGSPSFLMIARLLGDKGVREYGEAARRLKASYPDIRISLAGWIDASPNAITRSDLDRLIADGVEYLGRLDDVRPAISAHSIYVLPSYREGTPRSVLEAMAVGRAIVTTDAPGCRETVMEAENGFLVPPRDAEALFRAMERFLLEPELADRFGKASRRLVEQRFDVQKVNQKLLSYAAL